jgi:hypothetical protein
VDSQPKTQRSSREKTKYKHTVSNPNYSTELGWKWGKRGESSPFYRENLGFPLSFPPHGRASARPQARADALPRPCGPVAARTRPHGRGASVRPRHVGAGAGPRPRGRTAASARTRFLPRPCVKPRPRVKPHPRVKPRPRVNADVRGRPDEKDVRTDIFIQKRPL